MFNPTQPSPPIKNQIFLKSKRRELNICELPPLYSTPLLTVMWHSISTIGSDHDFVLAPAVYTGFDRGTRIFANGLSEMLSRNLKNNDTISTFQCISGFVLKHF